MFSGDRKSSQFDNANKSITFTCNLDSIDSTSELIKKVYMAITPKCCDFPAKIRKYGTREQNNLAHFISFPRNFFEYMFGHYNDTVLDFDKLDVTYFYDKNMLKKTDKSGREEMYVLMKITKQHDREKKE